MKTMEVNQKIRLFSDDNIERIEREINQFSEENTIVSIDISSNSLKSYRVDDCSNIIKCYDTEYIAIVIYTQNMPF
jgi:hypothetical protein